MTTTIVIVTSHSFKNSVTKIANYVYTELMNSLPSTSGNITLTSTLRSKLLKKIDKTIFSKERDLFWRGVKRWISL